MTRIDDRKPDRAPQRGADRGDRQGIRRDPRRGVHQPRRPRRALHPHHHRAAPSARTALARNPARLPLQARLAARHRRALHRQDPGEHGDRAQRDARPMGLDAGSRINSAVLGLGQRLHRRRPGSTPTTTSTTPSPTSAARTRISATRSCGSTRIRSGIPSICSSRSTTCSSPRSSSGASPPTTSTSRRSSPATKSKEQVRRELRGMGAQGVATDRQGLHRLSRAVGQKGFQVHPEGELHRQPRSATCGPTRSSSAATSPTRPTPSARRRSRTKPVATSIYGSCSAPPTSKGSPRVSRSVRNLGYQVEHHLFPDMPSSRYAQIAPKVKTSASATNCPTTAAASDASSALSNAPSCGWLSRAANPPQAGPLPARRRRRHRSPAHRRLIPPCTVADTGPRGRTRSASACRETQVWQQHLRN